MCFTPENSLPNIFSLFFCLFQFVLPLSGDPQLLEGVTDVPEALQLQAAQLALTNCGSQGARSTRTQLSIVTQRFQTKPFFDSDGRFPYCDGDLSCLPAYRVQSVGESSIDPALVTLREVRNGETTDNGTAESSPADEGAFEPGRKLAEVWFLEADQIWLDFVYHNRAGGRQNLVPFLGAIPIDMWVCRLVPVDGAETSSRMHMLIESDRQAHVLLERAELLWLLSLRDEFECLYSTIMAMLFEDAANQPVIRKRLGTLTSQEDAEDSSSASTFQPGDEAENLIALALSAGLKVSLLLLDSDKPVPRQRSETSLLGQGNRLMHFSRDSPEAAATFATLTQQREFASSVNSPVSSTQGSYGGDTASMASFGSHLESDASSMVDTMSMNSTDLLSASNFTAPDRSTNSSPYTGSSMSLNNPEKTSEKESAFMASAAHSNQTDDSGVNAGGTESIASSHDELSSPGVSRSASSADNAGVVTLLHVSVSSLLGDIQSAGGTSRVIVKAQHPHLEPEILRTAMALQTVVYRGIGKSPLPEVDEESGEVLVRMSMGDGVPREAAGVGLIDPDNPPELMMGLLRAHARGVNVKLSEKYFDSLADFFKLPKSGGVLPLDVEASSCHVEIEPAPQPPQFSTTTTSSDSRSVSAVIPPSTILRVGRVKVSCNPVGEWLIGAADPAGVTTSQNASDGTADAEADPARALAQRQLEQDNARLRQQLAQCRQTMEQACSEREALLQTILRLQDEITSSNIAQDELHSELYRLRDQLRVRK